VVLAGLLWGDWMALEERVRSGLACLARIDDLDEDDADALDEADVETAAAEFRYARDLVAAADLEAWLERRGLSVEAWLDFIRRGLLIERWTDDLEETGEPRKAKAGRKRSRTKDLSTRTDRSVKGGGPSPHTGGINWVMADGSVRLTSSQGAKAIQG
jgi:prepilin-type processing-associated H-X9-DG protein